MKTRELCRGFDFRLLISIEETFYKQRPPGRPKNEGKNLGKRRKRLQMMEANLRCSSHSCRALGSRGRTGAARKKFVPKERWATEGLVSIRREIDLSFEWKLENQIFSSFLIEEALKSCWKGATTRLLSSIWNSLTRSLFLIAVDERRLGPSPLSSYLFFLQAFVVVSRCLLDW